MAAFDLLPEGAGKVQQLEPSERFKLDYTVFLHVAFLAMSGLFVWLNSSRPSARGS